MLALKRRIENNEKAFFWIAAVVLSVLTVGGLIWRDVHPSQAMGDVAAEGNIPVLQQMLESGDDANARGRRGETPLIRACQKGQLAAVQMLLRAGAKPNLRGEGNQTALHAAVACDDVQIIACLLEAGADQYLEDDDGVSPFLAAIQRNHASVSMFLDRSRGLELGKNWHNGARSGCLPLLRWSLDRGIDVDVLSPQGGNALLYAVSREHFEAAELLIDAGSDVTLADRSAKTPLHYAAINGDIPMAQLLLDSGADLEARDYRGFTPLFSACATGRVGMMKRLVDLGADIDGLDNDGRSLEEVAGGARRQEVVYYMQKHRLDLQEGEQDPLAQL